MRLVGRAPLRIDFAGGWTDVPFYAEEHGGAVVNAAITRYVRGELSDAAGGLLEWLRPHNRGGVSYHLDLPTSSGLGSSAAQTVLWAALVRTSIADTLERRDIAEIACQIAKSLGILGGKQDEYASALGGVNFFVFGNSVTAERLELGAEFLEQLLSRLVLCWSGTSRLSTSIHACVWNRYASGDPEVVEALSALANIARRMRFAFLHHDFPAIAALIAENWTYQKRLHPTVTNPDLDALIAYGCEHGAVAGKACGAGGGGCVLFLADENQRPRLAVALQKAGIHRIDFDFDSMGVYIGKG